MRQGALGPLSVFTLLGYLIANAFSGLPTACGILSGGATHKNSYAPSAGQSFASSSNVKISPSDNPMSESGSDGRE